MNATTSAPTRKTGWPCVAAIISSFDQKPASGKIPEIDSVAIKNVHVVVFIFPDVPVWLVQFVVVSVVLTPGELTFLLPPDDRGFLVV